MPTEHDQAKQRVRERVWDALDAAAVVHDVTSHGRIPDFHGKDQAAERLAALPRWKTAGIIKSVPDKAQLPVRVAALAGGKIVYMAVPKLATPKPFYVLDPAALTAPPEHAASSHIAATIAPTVDVEALQPIDIVVLGSVAVNRAGVRIGKGAGYSDIEFALLTEAGLISPDTLIVTTVHALQVVDEPIPATEHDVTVDLIITAEEVIRTTGTHRPSGILWDHLTPVKIAQIPALALRASRPIGGSSKRI
ncbi:5-formyltetrahydrofolate cyclo-ligase [Streptomyces sp. SID3343]|uniref:5-formyltetrahydrofolate cyclo-ligase n=1 Tax=Streptomyces sp. SID3343 TaxID=2690260 RepID=UPI001371E2BD|nr:5-formyltetrahydrofolate cyclo-ligase [Streptomyces sp. SID3343]